MSTPRVLRVGFVALAIATSGWAGGGVPVAVSPGHPAKLALIGDRCPTFSWGEVDAAKKYELVVYRLGEEGEEAQPVLQQSFSGSVSGWTPSLDRCLERGGRYAWSVRAVGGEEASDWSAPSLFLVAAGPSAVELEEALRVVRRYLVTQGGAEADGAARAEPESGAEVSASSPAPAAVGATQLTVDGGVVATSFTGDGSTLTSLDPANLSPGTAGIDISGNAATATNATTAATATDADTVDGAHAAALEESSEIDADKNLPSDHHGRYTDAEVSVLIAAAVYWSATEFNDTNAWFVNLLNAGFNFFSKGNDNYVWPVRVGQ